MSRIHHARKSADLDRTALQAVDEELERLGETPATGRMPVQASSSLQSPADGTHSGSSLGCRQSNWAPDPEMTIFFDGAELTRGAEEFRSLRSRLYLARKQQSFKSLLVASALPKEGRSFVATNLARVLALQAGSRVLLVDADLRNPRLHSAFGTSAQPGLAEYLLHEVEESTIMQRGRSDSLFLIPSGRTVQGQSELVANGRVQSLLDRVESFFDWIIIDSPPAISVTDAGLLAHCCDGVLLVVRSHSTPFDAVQKARDRFREESLIGVVLNDIPAKASPQT